MFIKYVLRFFEPFRPISTLKLAKSASMRNFFFSKILYKTQTLMLNFIPLKKSKKVTVNSYSLKTYAYSNK